MSSAPLQRDPDIREFRCKQKAPRGFHLPAPYSLLNHLGEMGQLLQTAYLVRDITVYSGQLLGMVQLGLLHPFTVTLPPLTENVWVATAELPLTVPVRFTR